MSAAPASPGRRLQVTGLGLVTSVGWNAAACAAIAAGISRPTPLAATWLDTETFDEVQVVGHPVKGYTDGFNLMGCWLRLARGALGALREQLAVPPASDSGYWGGTALLAALPSPDPARFQLEEGAPDELRESFLPALLSAAELPIDPRRAAVLPRGHVGTAEALRAALEQAGPGRAERVLLLAVDSYLDPLTVQWLGAAHRLKDGDAPTGLAPGEAAACLLLEEPGSAHRRRVAASATVVAAAIARGPARREGAAPDGGRALAQAIEATLASVSPDQPFSGDVVLDLNGETWRAAEWGGALSRLTRRLGDLQLHLPAASLGDTGAASGAVGLCLATHLLARGRAGGPVVLVVSSSDSGEVGCVAVEGRRP